MNASARQELRILHPGAVLTADEAVSELTFGEWARPDRPYLVLNMVTTLDGRVALGGRAGPIGNEADRELFDRLRTVTDAVMVGARTATVEGYHRLVSNPIRREQREARGPLRRPSCSPGQRPAHRSRRPAPPSGPKLSGHHRHRL